MSCTTYIVYTFHLSLHHANFGQFKAKQVLSTFYIKEWCRTYAKEITIFVISLTYAHTIIYFDQV